MTDVERVRLLIREKILSGQLPRQVPEKLVPGFGNGQTCDGCDETIYGAQVEYDIDMPGGRLVRLHFGCSGLWQAELLRGEVRRAAS
jgi:hypothetical protein